MSSSRNPSIPRAEMMGFAKSSTLLQAGVRAPFPQRHCERSEAIHLSARVPLDCFVAPLLAMTTRGLSHVPGWVELFAKPINSWCGGIMGFAKSSTLRQAGVRAPFPQRHCERSEAIHLSARALLDCFVAPLLAMTTRGLSHVAGWVELFAKPINSWCGGMMGFAKSSTHPTTTKKSAAPRDRRSLLPPIVLVRTAPSPPGPCLRGSGRTIPSARR